MSKCSPYPPEKTADLGGEHVLPLSTSPHRADPWTFFPFPTTSVGFDSGAARRERCSVLRVLCYSLRVVALVP